MTVAAGSTTPHHHLTQPATDTDFPLFPSVFIPSRRPTGSQPLFLTCSSLSARGIVKVHLGTSVSGVLRVNPVTYRGMQACVCFCLCVCVRARVFAHANMCVPARQGPSTLTVFDRYGRLEVGCAAVTRPLPGSRSAVSLSRGRRGHSCSRQALFHHMRRRASDSVTLALRHNRLVLDVDSTAFCRQIKSEVYLQEQLDCCNLMFFCKEMKGNFKIEELLSLLFIGQLQAAS